MKNKIIYTLLLTISYFLWNSCSNETSVYDIDFPVAKILNISDDQPFVDEEITITGENLNTATSVGIDAYEFKISSVSDDGNSMVVKVPRNVAAGELSVSNEYGRKYNSGLMITPQFFPAIVVSWPSEIQQNKPFILEGENMDLIKEVKVNGTSVSLLGAAKPEAATYTSIEADLAIGDEVTIVVIPKAGDTQTSGAIKVVQAIDTYLPKQTLMVIDINKDYTVEDGNDAAQATMEEVTGLLGTAFRVTAPVGNGWNGTYCKIYSDNNGKGFDLSAYNDPHITMLINSNGKQGYVQPLTYDASNGEQDRHLTTAFGYDDDYMSTTNGWEWRSYSMEELDFPVVKGMIDKIGIQFRGGNVGNGNNMAYDMSVNMVMITDGHLNPTVAWDCETEKGGAFELKNTGSGGLEGVNEGNKYISYTQAITSSWNWMTDASVEVAGLDAQTYANGIWVNMLINTGNNYGYCQLEFDQDGNALTWFNFTGEQGYGDDYKFVPTENQWKWRSVQIDPNSFGLDATRPFVLKVGATTGNWDTGTYELNLDYIVFTTTPLDPNLNTDDL